MYSKLRMRLAISRHLGKDEAIHSEYSIKSVEYFVGNVLEPSERHLKLFTIGAYPLNLCLLPLIFYGINNE